MNSFFYLNGQIVDNTSYSHFSVEANYNEPGNPLAGVSDRCDLYYKTNDGMEISLSDARLELYYALDPEQLELVREIRVFID